MDPDLRLWQSLDRAIHNHRMVGEDEVLRIAERFLREEVGPRAQEIDRDPESLHRALKGLCDRDLMALNRPKAFGGPALSPEAFSQFQESCARYSGTLAFLQTQHQRAVAMLAASSNEALKAECLPRMGNGARLAGIGFSQLRRSGPPIMRATPAQGGHLLDGHVPWVTGFDFFGEFLIGASLPDGRALFALVPLQSTPPFQLERGSLDGGIRISPPMKLAAMEAANTVTVDFESFYVPEDRVCFVKEAGWIRQNDEINVALQGHFALGCARAGLDVLGSVAEQKGLDFAAAAYTRLAAELESCREQTRIAKQGVVGEIATSERLKVRAWAVDLAVRCAHAAVAASSGAANTAEHPAQRIYREALVYTVSAQTTQIMEATLARLTR